MMFSWFINQEKMEKLAATERIHSSSNLQQVLKSGPREERVFFYPEGTEGTIKRFDVEEFFSRHNIG